MNKEELKQDILLTFKKHLKSANQYLPEHYWLGVYIKDFKDDDRRMFVEAVAELVNEGKIVCNNDEPQGLTITQLGYDEIKNNKI